MAKKASILNENYNPVGEKLKRALEIKSTNTSSSEIEEPANKKEPLTNSLDILESRVTEFYKPKKKEEVKAKTYELRCRCSKSERDKWNKFAMNFTGEPNHFSHLFRSMLLLLEHAEVDLETLSRKVKEIEKPSKGDLLGVSFYEQKLASYIFEALRRAGKPNWRH